MKYRAAAIQFDPVIGAQAENIARMTAFINSAARGGAQLIVCPEMATSGYCFRDRDEALPFAETIPGPSTTHLEGLARHHACVIVCGLLEVDDRTGLLYNTAVVIDASGYIGKYRKIHFFSADARWGVEGDLGLPVWHTTVGCIGVEICMDATYPESGRLLTLAGADVICFPTNWVGSPCPDDRWVSQAFENGVYWLAADRAGVERGMQFMGGSCLIEPNGAIQSVATLPEEIVFGEIDLARTAQHRFGNTSEDKLDDRRPELYRDMLQNTYGWSPAYFHSLYGDTGLPPAARSRVAVVQFAPGNEVEQNLNTIRSCVRGQPADLIVLPELALTGPVHATADKVTADPELLNVLARVAAEYATMLVTSVVETEGKDVFLSVVLVNAQGVLHRERKRHLTVAERAWARPGSGVWEVADTPVGRLGLVTGTDALYWETLRVLSTKGVDVLCVTAGLSPDHYPSGTTSPNWNYWRVKAWESCAVLALANSPAPQGAGRSGIWVPDVRAEMSREVIQTAEQTGTAVIEIDTNSRYLREKRALAWRRLQHYTPLVVTNPSENSIQGREAYATRQRIR